MKTTPLDFYGKLQGVASFDDCTLFMVRTDQFLLVNQSTGEERSMNKEQAREEYLRHVLPLELA